jgi:hypothetical protein
MHWLVEVSRVGEEAASERFCIDARRWQSALQETRRLRGDVGPVTKLTIELLDNGYRAVDPALRVRYVVTEAPADLPLTDGAQVLLSTRPPPAASVPPTSGSIRPLAPLAGDLVPSVGARKPAGPLAAQVVRQRDEQPEGDPIAYRELALAVKPGASREEVEALLALRLDEAKASMPPSVKRYVQIAVFDHMFAKRPVRPPLATLMWKEWRGEPVLAFPGFAGASQPPPSSLGSVRPLPSWLSGARPRKAPLRRPALSLPWSSLLHPRAPRRG